MNHQFTKYGPKEGLCKHCNQSYECYIHGEQFEISTVGHEFEPKNLCSFCNRDYIAHTPAARCESCQKCNTCSVIEDMLLCDKCAQAIKTKQFDLIEESRNNDQNIRSSQDLFNAATVPLISLRESINNNSTIENKDEAFKAEILTRYEHLCKVLFEKENEVHRMQVEKSVLNHNLDQLAHLIRTEERERIKVADANYIPPVRAKVIKPRVVKAEKKSVFDQLVEQFAKMNNVSETEAKITLTQQLNKSGKSVNQE